MRFFDGFDEHPKDELPNDTKLNIAEKATIKSVGFMAKLLINKVMRAKTYGDLRLLLEKFDPDGGKNNFFEKLQNKIEDRLEANNYDDQANIITEELQEAEKNLEEELGK